MCRHSCVLVFLNHDHSSAFLFRVRFNISRFFLDLAFFSDYQVLKFPIHRAILYSGKSILVTPFRHRDTQGGRMVVIAAWLASQFCFAVSQSELSTQDPRSRTVLCFFADYLFPFYLPISPQKCGSDFVLPFTEKRGGLHSYFTASDINYPLQ